MILKFYSLLTLDSEIQTIMSTPSLVYDELAGIIMSHVEEISQYVPGVNCTAENAPGGLLECIDRLVGIIQVPADVASYDLYREAGNCRDQLTSFLQVMNKPAAHPNSDDSTLSQILTQTEAWRKRVADELDLSNKDVWELIAPAIPDHLVNLGSGEYEARWWKPVPLMDIEILKMTEGVICDEPFEPEGLTGGLAVRFAVSG